MKFDVEGLTKRKSTGKKLRMRRNEFVIHDIKVIEGDKGLFIAMPSKKATDGEYRDIAHPINSTTRDRIQTTILERYQKALTEPEGEE